MRMVDNECYSPPGYLVPAVKRAPAQWRRDVCLQAKPTLSIFFGAALSLRNEMVQQSFATHRTREMRRKPADVPHF
jgi:hypothetical protein